MPNPIIITILTMNKATFPTNPASENTFNGVIFIMFENLISAFPKLQYRNINRKLEKLTRSIGKSSESKNLSPEPQAYTPKPSNT